MKMKKNENALHSNIKVPEEIGITLITNVWSAFYLYISLFLWINLNIQSESNLYRKICSIDKWGEQKIETVTEYYLLLFTIYVGRTFLFLGVSSSFCSSNWRQSS